MASYTVGTKVLGDWTIIRELGRGASGRVFEVEKADFGITTRAALKVVPVPPSVSAIETMRSEGMDEVSIVGACADMARELMSEVSLLASLGHPNVVRYQDHAMVAHESDPGCDVLLRMELLASLTEHMIDGRLPELEIVQVGEEIADALAFCHERGIVHRDVKPQNIFVDASGHHKLGDFGISRVTEGVTMTLSKKGTPPYMAPELVLGGHGDAKVDVYSLGIMLYQLLNNGRLPFYPDPPSPITNYDRQNAQRRRLADEPIPRIDDCNQALMSAVLRACSFDAHDRPSAAELRDQLRALEVAELSSDLPVGDARYATARAQEDGAPIALGGSNGFSQTKNVWNAFETEKGTGTVDLSIELSPTGPADESHLSGGNSGAPNKDEELSEQANKGKLEGDKSSLEIKPCTNTDNSTGGHDEEIEKRPRPSKLIFVPIILLALVALAFALIYPTIINKDQGQSVGSIDDGEYVGEWYVPTDMDRRITFNSNGEVTYGDDNHGTIASGQWTVIDKDAGAIKLTIEAEVGYEQMFEEGAGEFTRMAYAESADKMSVQLYYNPSDWETYIRQE